MKEFEKLYKEVFDTEGNVLACGREKCKELIKLANAINNNINFGDENTGFINIKNMSILYEEIKSDRI